MHRERMMVEQIQYVVAKAIRRGRGGHDFLDEAERQTKVEAFLQGMKDGTRTVNYAESATPKPRKPRKPR